MLRVKCLDYTCIIVNWCVYLIHDLYEPRHEKTCLHGFLNRSATNLVVQPQKMAGGFKGPGLIRGIFGLRCSEKVQLFGLCSHHKSNMTHLQNLSSNICFEVLCCHGNIDNHSKNAIFQNFPHFTAIFGALD